MVDKKGSNFTPHMRLFTSTKKEEMPMSSKKAREAEAQEELLERLNFESSPDYKDNGALVNEVVNEWKLKNNINVDVAEETFRAQMRIGSWVSSVSVEAGVSDIFTASIWRTGIQSGDIKELGKALGARLMSEGRLGGHTKKNSNLG